MRRFMIAAVLAVVAAAGVAACAKGSSTPSTTTAPATVADETAQVCAEAIGEGTAAAAEFRTKMNEGQQAFLAGDQAKATQIESELHQRVAAWAAKLSELSARPVKPEVKAVLDEMVTTINDLNREEDQTPVDQVEAKFVELGTKLAAACA